MRHGRRHWQTRISKQYCVTYLYVEHLSWRGGTYPYVVSHIPMWCHISLCSFTHPYVRHLSGCCFTYPYVEHLSRCGSTYPYAVSHILMWCHISLCSATYRYVRYFSWCCVTHPYVENLSWCGVTYPHRYRIPWFIFIVFSKFFYSFNW